MNERYSFTLPAGGHWSLRLRRGLQLKMADLKGNGNLAMLFFNPENLLERYNAPDTLKCQHTFKLTRGHCLYSDMGRIFCSIVEDSLGWHDTVCGNSNAAVVATRWGARNYQDDRNRWHQNGWDAFLVELAKYGLGPRDMAANVNFFSKVAIDDAGNLALATDHSPPGASVTLRIEMDCLVVMHACPHPMRDTPDYPDNPIQIDLQQAPAVDEDDPCRNLCPENQRGFTNNALYYLGRLAS